VFTRQGWLCLATILDLHSRRIVGWAMSQCPGQALASDASRMAVAHRQPPRGTIHLSDQGTQYTSKAYQHQLQEAGLTVSMSRKGMTFKRAQLSVRDIEVVREVLLEGIELFAQKIRTAKTARSQA